MSGVKIGKIAAAVSRRGQLSADAGLPLHQGDLIFRILRRKDCRSDSGGTGTDNSDPHMFILFA